MNLGVKIVSLHGFYLSTEIMGKFDLYKIPLKGVTIERSDYDFVLDNDFFKKIDSPEVERGNIDVTLQVNKKPGFFELAFQLEGSVKVPCDRCLDDMDQEIKHSDVLQVKLGTDYLDDGDMVIIPESDGYINIAWFLYEFIVINIPIKHFHAPSECNKTMLSKLKQHIIKRKNDIEEDEFNDIGFDDEENNESETDPRWDGLKNIIEN